MQTGLLLQQQEPMQHFFRRVREDGNLYHPDQGRPDLTLTFTLTIYVIFKACREAGRRCFNREASARHPGP